MAEHWPTAGEGEIHFKAFNWMPTFKLSKVSLIGDVMVHHGLDALYMASNMKHDPKSDRFVLPDEGLRWMAHEYSPGTLKRMLRDIPDSDTSEQAKIARWNLGCALAASAGNEALHKAGEDYLQTAAQCRFDYLLSVSLGRPPTARRVAEVQRRVPGSLSQLGGALPSKEAIALIAGLDAPQVIEVGAGVGLFARCLSKAGIDVVATDEGSSKTSAVGLAFPVLDRTDVVNTLEAMREARRPAPVVILEPSFATAWFTQPFERAVPGQVVLMASPAMEAVLVTGAKRQLALLRKMGAPEAEGLLAAIDLARRLERDFEPIGMAPMSPAGWPLCMTWLRAWRRRARSDG